MCTAAIERMNLLIGWKYICIHTVVKVTLSIINSCQHVDFCACKHTPVSRSLARWFWLWLFLRSLARSNHRLYRVNGILLVRMYWVATNRAATYPLAIIICIKFALKTHSNLQCVLRCGHNWNGWQESDILFSCDYIKPCHQALSHLNIVIHWLICLNETMLCVRIETLETGIDTEIEWMCKTSLSIIQFA